MAGERSFVPGMSATEVLIFTRLAGDKVGATKMDRPEDVQPSLHTGKIYAALTNNTNRGVAAYAGPDEPNPRNANKHGQILEIVEDRATYFAGYDKSAVSPISCPDNVVFDSGGNLWIATDGNALDSNDGLFATAIEGPERGHLKQFLTVPPGAETCGPFITGDDRSVFVAVQHPGEVTDATLDEPAPPGGSTAAGSAADRRVHSPFTVRPNPNQPQLLASGAPSACEELCPYDRTSPPPAAARPCGPHRARLDDVPLPVRQRL